MNFNLRALSYILISAYLAVCASVAQAVTPFKVQDIQVQGLQRVDPATVFTYLPIKLGDTANDTNIRDSIQALYATGLFADVSLEASTGDILLLSLVERPFIATVSFSGNKELDNDELKKIAKESGLAEGRAFDKAVLAKVEQDIKAAYLTRSKYGLKINTVSSPLERNRVNVLMELIEGDVAKIKEIKFLGNKAFSAAVLSEQMSSNTPTMMSWLTKSDRYAKEKLSADLETIRSFYLSKGYFDFSIESNQVSLSADKQEVFLTIVLSEGAQYTVSSMTVKGVPKEHEPDINALLTIAPQTLFNGESVNVVLQAMTTKLGELGFAMAQVNPVPTIDYEKRQLAFDLLVDVGPRTYVRRINITGNTRSRDEVIRREIRQNEAAWYDAEKIKSSRDRIDRLGFFKEVTVESVPVEGRFDQIDINFTVIEKPTGNINFGVGFNSTDKLSLTAGVAQDNIFGSGNNLSFNVNTAKTNRGVYLSATDPFFTDNGVSRSIELYAKTNKIQEATVDRVKIDTRGASMRFGVPISESDVVSLGGGLEYTGLTTYANAAARYIALEKKIEGSAIYPVATFGWGNDTRDSGLSPTKGVLKKLGIEVGVGKDIAFAKANYQYQTYYAISKDLTWASNADIGYGAGLSGKEFPFFKNYFVGGIGSVRGYQGNTLGAQDTNGDHIGGAKKVVLNTELLFPLPGTGKDRSAKLFLFLDGGYAWSDENKIKLAQMRYSGGIGLSWLSPIGPLKFSYGLPIKKQATDKLQKFQFQIGTGF
jgi:outer membrane protein insertion porin family